jgi:formate hydrogenlyase transcriptional activator
VRFNCAAIPLGLLESELFGHEKGAFTGAVARKIGRFELANQGTLFLDEIGDIPLELQAKLLRVLQEREFERLGSNQTQQVNVRLVAATHRDLKQMVNEGKFRSDLYFRLNIFPISVPPLRERREDIPLLVKFFAEDCVSRINRRVESIPASAIRVLTEYDWPGNVRELQNFIERAVILSPDTELRAPLEDLDWSKQIAQAQPQTLAQTEYALIAKALKETGWRVGGPRGAARRLGLKRTTLIGRMRKIGLLRSTEPELQSRRPSVARQDRPSVQEEQI